MSAVGISDVRGILTNSGVIVLVTGTAPECEVVNVVVGCPNSESRQDQIQVVDGMWEARFDPLTGSNLQCVCDEDIWVRVECVDGQFDSKEYSGTLRCSEESECPDVRLSSSVSDDRDVDGRYSVTVTATVSSITGSRLSARLLYKGNILDSNTSVTGKVTLKYNARFGSGSYLFTVAISEPTGCPNTSSTVIVPTLPEEDSSVIEPEAPENNTSPCSDDTVTSFDLCDPISDSESIKYRLDYRGHVLNVSQYYNAEGDTLGKLACNTLKDAILYPAAEYTMAQHWYFRGMTRGEVSAVLPLAPGEKTSVRLQISQRVQLKTSTVDSKEEMRSYEASISDKEVMEAMRTLTKNQQWSVNATAGVNYGGANASVSVGYQESVQSNVSSKLQQMVEGMEKVANQKKILHKIEVIRDNVTESINERVSHYSNPFRDRAISLIVYELYKHYCVDHVLDRVYPALVLYMPCFEFDRDFVLNNVQFLTRSLLDELLLSELQSSLAEARRPADLEGNEQRLNDFATLALRHLFTDSLVLPFTTGTRPLDRVETGFGDVVFSSEPILDDPNQSFLQPEHEASGWLDSFNKPAVNDLFVLLSSYRFLLLGGDLSGVSSLAEIVIALSDQVKELWTLIDDSHRINIYDTNNRTAVFRRVPAFLAIVDKFMRPLLKGPEDGLGGDDGFDSHQRAGLVINRVVNHLNCFQSYYTEQFHDYLFDLSAGSTYREFYYKFVAETVPESEHELFFRDFDLDRAFLDKTSLVIPYRGDSADEVLAEWFPGDPLGKTVKPLRLDVTLPADGAQIEAVAGHCVLPNIPPPLPSDLFDNVHLELRSTAPEERI